MDDWQMGMVFPRKQQTIAEAAHVDGVGYWSGREVRVRFVPAEADEGIVFVRDDLPGRPRISATVEHRTETPLRTTLACDGAGVDMIEHVMAALAGLQIDNCTVHVDQQEMPGCDGSSRAFVDALTAAGSVVQDTERAIREIRNPIRLGNGDRAWIEARPCCSGKTVLQYELDYGPNNPIGRQTLELVLSPETFCEQLAGCRTFLLESEARTMMAQGLGRHVSCGDLLVFGPDGPIDNELRFPDECVRHKLLDMVGDLALAGCDLAGRIIASRSGHRLNAELVRTILNGCRDQRELRRCA